MPKNEHWKIGRLYIYKQVDGKAQFVKAVKMVGFGLWHISPENPGCTSELKGDHDDIYEVWFPDYLEAKPNSQSDLMIEAGIRHSQVKFE